MNFEELEALTELSSQLTPAEIKRIKVEIGLPVALCEDTSQGIEFLYAVKGWDERNPYQFYQTLNTIRPDLTAVACKVKWLCASSPSACEYEERELSVKTLINLLSSEVTKSQWLLIYMNVSSETGVNVGFEIALKMLLQKGLIEKDLKTLKQILRSLQRHDVADKLNEYQNVFAGMEVEKFISKFKIEIGIQTKDIQEWEQKLKEFSKVQYGKVKQMLGKEKEESMERVFVDLTILKQEPREINLEDETTYNEIAYLRKIANKEVKITPVDFTEELITYRTDELEKEAEKSNEKQRVGKWEIIKVAKEIIRKLNPRKKTKTVTRNLKLMTYETIKPEIWCIIGNPGCGKTFLAKRTALRFSSSELIGIKYSISIPCRSTDWHAMESTRYEEGIEIEKEYISKWLCLGLPKGANWSNDLAKHLAGSDGEGLLMIVDGLDEFTRKVPFEKTFLCSLLTRQSLTRSTIILTSRPGAWTSISSANELIIDRYYQVLGFSPENRDLYFKKQITNESKQKQCWHLMERHDEINQLSLIPVNASLFAALMKGEASTSINTLTQLYYELVLYMIRRELCRIGLKEYSRVSRISNLHEDILACLYRIGFIALLGVANRDLASEENVTLNLEQEEYTCQCLGLAHEHYRKESVGLMKQVWTFVHLTMQEFVSALYLEHTTWTEQCYSVRYISHSEANFSLFRMVVRFLCGLLSDKSAALLSILYRYLTPQPIQLIDMPMSYQLDYSQLYHHEGWNQFTKIYFQLAAILFETNSDSIPLWFNNFKQYFPMPMYLYVRETVFPNEWICFIQTLKLVCRIQLIYIYTSHISPTQFNSLIQEMRICSVNLLALYFDNKDSTTVLTYTDIIRETGMKFDTKISIELFCWNSTAERGVNLFPTATNQIIDSLRIVMNDYSFKALKEIINHFSAIQYLCVDESGTNYNTMLPALCQATQLRVLHLYDIPSKHIRRLTAVLPQFSKLQDIGFDNSPLLPAISHLSNLTYLRIREIRDSAALDKTLCDYLLQIINGNRDSLRGMELWSLHRIGLNNWSLLLSCLEVCTNLVQLKLLCITLPSDDVTHWSRAVNKMKSLVELEFYHVSFSDTGLLSLCEGLIYHPAIRSLELTYCKLTSLSCGPLTHLIPTLSQLEALTIKGLSEPDGHPILLLKETADEFGIEHELK